MRPAFIATPMCSTQLRLHEGESTWLPLPTSRPHLLRAIDGPESDALKGIPPMVFKTFGDGGFYS